MSITIIGAGFGRTGTHSLKVALEQLLGGTCHHMVEVFSQPDQIEQWRVAATTGPAPDWHEFLAGYSAIVDWPGAAFWPELAAAFPDAPVLLSLRSAESWWKSASETILIGLGDQPTQDNAGWHEMVMGLVARHGITDLADKAQCLSAFDANIAKARAEVPPERLIEWTPADGWGPLCRALAVDEPDEPFPVTNTTAQFREMRGIDPI